MKTRSELRAFYTRPEGSFQAVEAKRLALTNKELKKYRWHWYSLYACALLSFLAYQFLPVVARVEWLTGALVFGNLALFIGMAVFIGIQNSRGFNPVKTEFINTVIKPTLAHINGTLAFDHNPNVGLAPAEYTKTGFLGGGRFDSYGLVTGTIDTCSLRASEVKVSAKIQSDGPASLVFKGIYGILKTTIDFGSGLYIRPVSKEKASTVAGTTITAFFTGKEYGEEFASGDVHFDSRYTLTGHDAKEVQNFVSSPFFRAFAALDKETKSINRYYLKGHEIHVATNAFLLVDLGQPVSFEFGSGTFDLIENVNYLVDIAGASCGKQ